MGDLLTNVEAAQAFINTNTTQIIKTVSWGARESHELSGGGGHSCHVAC